MQSMTFQPLFIQYLCNGCDGWSFKARRDDVIGRAEMNDTESSLVGRK